MHVSYAQFLEVALFIAKLFIAGGVKQDNRGRNGSKEYGRSSRGGGRDRGRRQEYRSDDRGSSHGSRDYDSRGGGGYDRSRPAKRRNYGVTVRVRGIPFSTTEDELADFFQEYSVCPYMVFV